MRHLILSMSMQAVQTGPDLDAMYSAVAGYRQIIDGVRSARELYEASIESLGHQNGSTSRVHSDHDVEIQAFAMAIPSMGHPDEITSKAFITYGSHRVDDYFDNPELSGQLDMQKIINNRSSVFSMIGETGKLYKLILSMAEMAGHWPYGVLKGVYRIAYGGLIQQAGDKLTQEGYMDEYKTFSLREVDFPLGRDAEKIRPVVYWTTTKAVQEMFFACEPGHSPVLAEAWSLIYAPVSYLFNHKKKKWPGKWTSMELKCRKPVSLSKS